MPRFDTRLALMRAAEQLFAQQGVDRVSLREIAVAAGQRNVSAATYHFGSKRELIESILERHSRPVQDDWLRILEAAKHGMELRQLIELLVRPIVDKIDDADGGRCYLELCAELVTSRSFPLISMRIATNPGAAALGKSIAEQGPRLPSALATLRGTRLAAILYTSIADYLRLSSDGMAPGRDAFITDLISVLVSVVRAPVGELASNQAAGVANGKKPEMRPE
jgi:AcrR family transcriptional regulator